MNIRLEKNTSVLARTNRSVWMVAASLVASLLMPAGQVFAQGTSATLEEIVVTSRRYEESISDAPLAVNVLDSEYLAKQGVNTLSGPTTVATRRWSRRYKWSSMASQLHRRS